MTDTSRRTTHHNSFVLQISLFSFEELHIRELTTASFCIAERTSWQERTGKKRATGETTIPTNVTQCNLATPGDACHYGLLNYTLSTDTFNLKIVLRLAREVRTAFSKRSLMRAKSITFSGLDSIQNLSNS